MDTSSSSHFFLLSQQYLHTTSLLVNKMLETDNKWVCVYSGSSTDESLQKKYTEDTKWSDFNTLPPSLFLFFHGLELLVKGLISLSDKAIPKNHHLDNLVLELSDQSWIDSELQQLLRKYSTKNLTLPFINNFLDDNKIEIHSLYVDIRYPNKSSNSTDFSSLTYNDIDLCPQLRLFVADIESIISTSVSCVNAKLNSKEILNASY